MTPVAAGHPGMLFVCLGLAAAALWGASDFLGGLATRKAHVVGVVAIAHSLSLALLLPLALLTHAVMPAHQFVVLGLGAGTFGGIAITLYYQALSMGEMGIITALTGLLTALVPVAVSSLTQGKPKSSQVAGFVLAAAAIVLIAYAPKGRARPLALGFAALAGMCFGVFLVILQLGSAKSIVWQLIFSRIASATMTTFLVLWLRFRKTRPPPVPAVESVSSGPLAWRASKSVTAWLAGSAGILEATGSLLYMRAAHQGRLDVAAVLASLYPAVTILLAMWILKEKTTSTQTLGMALALIAVVLVSI